MMQHIMPVIWAQRKIWNDECWLDLWIYRVNACDGLPPSARAKVIRGVYRQLKQYRSLPCLWVQVDAPGDWYITALRWALQGHKIMVNVSPVEQELSVVDFPTLPPVGWRPWPQPQFGCSVFDEANLTKVQKAELKILRCMARMEMAGVKEIASLAGFGVTYTRKLLARLSKDRLVQPFDSGSEMMNTKDPLWAIRQRGLQYVRQSWNIPYKFPFRSIRVEQKYAGRKHRKMCRLFRSRVEKAYGADFQVWQSWSEPALAYANPDAVIWGTYRGVETLVWLEVETGKKSAQEHVKEVEYRCWQAMEITERHGIQLIFVFLAMPWVLRAVAKSAYFPLTKRIAIILDNWMDYENLARPNFEGFNSISSDNEFNLEKKTNQFSYDSSFFQNLKKH
jgi:hypothetical protein